MAIHSAGRIEPMRLVLISATASLLSLALAAHAQDAGQAGTPSETVIVTGSRIARIANEGALPVQVITREQVLKTGATTAEQFLQTVSAALQGNNNTVAASGSGATTGGVSGASLRGLGSQRTLVLINGRRIAGGGTITDSATVDINNIPIAAVERVEVLKDGASAIYGSDAIAGVINFILRKDFEGAEVNVYGGTASDGGAGTKKADVLLGFGNLNENRYNVMFGGSYQKQDTLYGRDRDFSKSGISVAHGQDPSSGNTFPANVVSTDPDIDFGTVNPNYPNCAPSVVDKLRAADYKGCRFDPGPYVSLLPATERASVFGALHFALTDNMELYGEASFNHSSQRFVIQPNPLSDAFALPANNPLFNLSPYNGSATINLAPSSPYYPTAFIQGLTGGPTPVLDVFYRAFIAGPRDLTDTSSTPRAVLGLKGTAGGWDYDANLLYSETKLTETVNNGYPAYSLILPILNSGQVNFFGPNTAATQALVNTAEFRGDAYSTKTSITGVSASASRDLTQLPAGPLGFAIGGEFRKEKFISDPSAAIQSGDIAGYGGNFLPVDRSRNVKAVFAEFNVPIVPTLESDVAVRYDDYQGTGEKTTPKVDLRWKPLNALLFRSSWGKGFRAPSLTDLYGPRTQGVSSSGLSDPLRCTGGAGDNARDCQTQFTTLSGGNPKLKPEESTNLTLGVVFEPTRNLSIGIDAFYVKLSNTIVNGVDPSNILASLGTFGNLITRGPPDPATPGLPGHITQIDQTEVNFGQTKVKGADLDLRARLPTDSAGSFAFGVVGTYFATYQIQNPDGTFTNVKGIRTGITNGTGGVIPIWHHYLSVDWLYGDWDVTAAQNFQSSYQDLAPNAGGPVRDVASYVTYDVQGSYAGIEHLKLAVGAKNLLNKDPPYSTVGGIDLFQEGYDAGYGDPRGRFIYGQVTFTFK